MSSGRRHATRFYGAVVFGVLAASAAILLRTRPYEAGPSRTEVHEREGASWCGVGLESIAGEGCFAPSKSPERSTALLVYLHGRYSAESASEERDRQARVARLGTARGHAVLALRGKQGQCTDPRFAAWWCWPSTETRAPDGPAFVARWSVAVREAERRSHPARRVLLGFSNGGYFAALIASRALAPFDAVAVAHAGPVDPMVPVGARPPMLLVDADDDPSGPEMSRLDSALTREGWPHVVVVREGGHALPDWDVAMALAFFDRVRTEPMPLTPPLAARTTRNASASTESSRSNVPQASATSAPALTEPESVLKEAP